MAYNLIKRVTCNISSGLSYIVMRNYSYTWEWLFGQTYISVIISIWINLQFNRNRSPAENSKGKYGMYINARACSDRWSQALIPGDSLQTSKMPDNKQFWDNGEHSKDVHSALRRHCKRFKFHSMNLVLSSAPPVPHRMFCLLCNLLMIHSVMAETDKSQEHRIL